jgi:hypothetical protein
MEVDHYMWRVEIPQRHRLMVEVAAKVVMMGQRVVCRAAAVVLDAVPMSIVDLRE